MLDDRHHRLVEEVERLRYNMAARTDGRAFPLGVRWSRDGTSVDYIYRQHQLICRTRDVSKVLTAFDQIGQERPTVTEGPLDLSVLHLGDRDTADFADQLSEVLGDHVVTPNHVLDVKSNTVMCPATEPMPARGPVSDLSEPSALRTPRVAVIDTGYLPSVADDSGYSRFSAVTPDSTPDHSVFDGDGTTIRPYGGHGTAAAACLLAVSGAENVSVTVSNCMEGGAVDEISMIETLTEAVEAGADVISMQAGTYTRKDVPPLTFEAFRDEVLAKHPDTVIVVAAGNDSQDEPFWPAAYDWATAVGGLTEDGEARAEWSNFGDWVDVYAPGEDVTVPFPNGEYTYHGGFTTEFTDGHAKWSGTSFATPAVAGMITRRMMQDGVDAPTARDRILADAHEAAIPDDGPRVIPAE
jgi:hypothetical protein